MTANKFRTDSGTSLAEIMVYTALVILVMIVVTSLFTTIFRVQSAVSHGTQATQTTQLIANSVENAVRNATAVSVQTIGSSDQLVLARTAGSDSAGVAWQCDAWYFDSANQQLRFTSSSVAITVPSHVQLASWQLLGSGVRSIGGAAVFNLTGSRLSVMLKATVTGMDAVNLKTSASIQAGTWVSSPCF